VPTGIVAILRPGESITLPPYLCHEFWAEADAPPSVIGEVSAVNDDENDNFFLKNVGRFPKIEENTPPLHCLCTGYPMVQ
jgi:D-lyxose ketol-isomerase